MTPSLRKPKRAKRPLARRQLLATLVADGARKAYRDDVFARKNAIATGRGVAHGQLFTMIDWGLAAD